MANITVTTSGNSLIVNFGVYASTLNSSQRSYAISDIVEIDRANADDHVDVLMRDAHGVNRWSLTRDNTYSGDQYFIIDSINSNPIPSNQSLFNQLTALR